jgi:large subunit ribosomal protein L3
VQRKSKEKDGYSAVQVGFVERRAVKRVTKAIKGHFAKAGLPPCRVLREFPVEAESEVKVGDKVSVELFAAGDEINVTGISKGKGFQGVVKRHHFRGGAATHGSMFHRAPGSIGASAFPSRVIKGMRAAGHMGSERVTVRNVVVRVDSGNNISSSAGRFRARRPYVVIGGGCHGSEEGKAPSPRPQGRSPLAVPESRAAGAKSKGAAASEAAEAAVTPRGAQGEEGEGADPTAVAVVNAQNEGARHHLAAEVFVKVNQHRRRGSGARRGSPETKKIKNPASVWAREEALAAERGPARARAGEAGTRLAPRRHRLRPVPRLQLRMPKKARAPVPARPARG